MHAKKVKEHCDKLHDLIDVGAGDNPDILRNALSIVRSLRAPAEWDYPRQILEDLKVRLLAWFGDRQWRGDNAELLAVSCSMSISYRCPGSNRSATKRTHGVTLRQRDREAGMLILTRYLGESVKIGDEVTVTVLAVKGPYVRL